MSKRFFNEYVTSGLELRELPYESHPIDALYRYHDGKRLSSWSPNRKPKKILDWLKKKAIKHGVDESVALLLESAEQLAKKETITDQKQYDELVREVTRIIQAKIDVAVPQDMEHGKKFKKNKRGKGIVTALVDEELEKILMDFGPDLKVFDPNNSEIDLFKIIRKLIVEGEYGHRVFEEIEWDEIKKEPYIIARNPDKKSQKKDFTVSAIKKRLSPIRKKMLNNKK